MIDLTVTGPADAAQAAVGWPQCPAVDVFVETDRLVLRRFTDADLESIVELDCDPEVKRYIDNGVTTPAPALFCGPDQLREVLDKLKP